MKAALVLCFAMAACVLGRPEETYTDRWDNTNVTEITENEKLMLAYVNCCMGRGKCTPDGKELKSRISEALQNECAKCTEAQKKGMEIVIKKLINDMPDSWAELVGKYDPTGEYSKKYESRLKEIKQ